MYVYICKYKYIYAYTYMYICIYIYINTYTYTHIHTQIRIHANVPREFSSAIEQLDTAHTLPEILKKSAFLSLYIVHIWEVDFCEFLKSPIYYTKGRWS